MIKNGANGYLCKDCEQAELLKAIRTVSLGRRYVSPRTAELLADEMSGGRSGEPHENLSDRELQVFLRLVRGESVSEIAEQLHLSVKTICTFRLRLFVLLFVSCFVVLVSFVFC